MASFQVRKIKDLTRDLDDSEALEALDVVSDRVAKVDAVPKDGIIHIAEAWKELEEVEAERGQFIGLHTGYRSLDKKMGGLEPGAVVLVGGETSNGKSMLALNIAMNVAKTMDNVLYISLEMTRKQVWKRISLITQMSIEQLTNELDLSLQESFDLEYADIEPLVAKAVEENGCQLVVIDYLQYLGRGMNEREVAKMSKVVKRIALRYNVCMMVIVSLRKGEGGMNKRKWTDIVVEDLMGTAALGYDCDTAIITSRKDLENMFQPDRFYVKVLKTRNGDLDYNNPFVELHWDRMQILEAPPLQVTTGDQARQQYQDDMKFNH